MYSNNFGDILGMFVKILFDVLYHDGYWVLNTESNWLKMGFGWIQEILSKILFKFENRNETIQIDLLSHSRNESIKIR